MKTHNALLSRRALIRNAAAAAAIGALGSRAAVMKQAKAAAGERKFLFFFAEGGWDATPLDPKFGADGQSAVGGTDMDAGTSRGEAGNLTWSSGPDRAAMDTYFANWYNKTSLIRGVNMHSTAHDTGMQWMMTGSTSMSAADWPTILAATSDVGYPMPHLVFSGPNFPGQLGAAVVRGGGGSLLDLITGQLLTQADTNSTTFVRSVDAMIDAHAWRQGTRFAEGKSGLAKIRASAYLESLDRAKGLEDRQFETTLGTAQSGTLDQALMALEVMRLGLTRCAMVRIPGGWDTHGGNGAVGGQLNDFFGVLDECMSYLSRTPGYAAPFLMDEVAIFAMSELGRTPRFNGAMGRDHWTYTSLLAAGAGVKGNVAFGSTDDEFLANPTDFITGRSSPSGILLGTEHVGATILTMGNAKVNDFLNGVPACTGLLAGGA